MPRNLPTAAELFEQKHISFFSIDTDVIQSHGFKFGEGALHALALQRPNWITAQLTDVVEREVLDHRMAPVLKADQELASALDVMERLGGIDFSDIKTTLAAHKAVDSARTRFGRELTDFLRRLGGGILPLKGTGLVRDLFNLYFDQKPPFEERKSKKFEFPDGAALLVLEAHAKAGKTKGVLISNDGGWERFAAESEHLYCVKSLDEFTSLFQSHGPEADSVVLKVKNALANPDSELNARLNDHLSNHVNGAFWEVGELYTGSSHRQDGTVDDVFMTSVHIDPNNAGIWFCEHDPSVCVIELTASVTVQAHGSVDFFLWDTIDHEEMAMGSAAFERDAAVEVDLFLTCRGDLLASDLEDWDIGVEMSGGNYVVDVGEIELDYSDGWMD